MQIWGKVDVIQQKLAEYSAFLKEGKTPTTQQSGFFKAKEKIAALKASVTTQPSQTKKTL